ncbi:hypothetical protein CMT41_14645 [Colwellia sp. MT41]|uniref:RodZ domain-containing protein n=1 Tax=Colwellia sp. MT41 TaxID=58049 RepID=UPI00071771CB|nr:RodZ domain-containing protein [Colwellia sp. MT41]ALO35819.1 hypothetical protein CMT41_14645 [Colwellia sp. MT41]
MINDVTPTGKPDKEQQGDITEPVTDQIRDKITELSEDMEMVSPGAMLRDARKALSLSQEYITSKLNFKVALVNDMEHDIFDPLIPVTFTRGYLVNYAKLVAVDVDDVLARYDALDAANIQRSEMLSFSNETTKQAEHSRVMWLSYLIVAVLVGLTVLWWQQDSDQQAAGAVNVSAKSLAVNLENTSEERESAAIVLNPLSERPTLVNSQVQAMAKNNKTELVSHPESEPVIVKDTQLSSAVIATSEVSPSQEPEISTAVFTFIGDCWVNIFDATGERIAWGVKKSGYVMTIEGKAPLRITVGKPELTSIVFNGQPVDMSAFAVGNIAKFNLPIIAE